MAKPAARHPSSPSSHLTLRVLFLVLLVSAVAAGGVAAWAEWRIRSAAPATGAGDLDAAVGAQSRADDQRLEALTNLAARLARRDDLPLEGDRGPAAEEADEPTARLRSLIGALEDVLDERQVELIVLRGGGEMALGVGAPADAARELAVSRLMDRALDEGEASGTWTFGDQLYRVAAERVERAGETVGAVAVADRIGRAAAIRSRAVSRAETVYLVGAEEGEGATVVASTLDRQAGERLIEALSAAGVLAPVLEGADNREVVDVRIGGTTYRAVVSPLGSGSANAAAARVALVETGAGGRQLRMVQAAALAGGLAALLLGVLGAPLVTRGAGTRSREVAAAAEAARSGDLAGAARHAIPAPLARFFEEAAEKRALESVVASLGRSGGALAGDGGTAGAAERQRGAALVVEMPRYGRTGADQDPREVADRLGRDLVRVRRAVTSRGGRMEAALGHRALAVFDGERAGARAVGAAAEVMKALSAPENAFDDPTLPAIALATGDLIVGGPEGARTVTGLPVQQAESLLREASSGDLIVAKKTFRDLAAELAAGGVEVAAQRGLLTPQPVYLLGADQAARAAAALGTSEGAAAAALSSLAPGVVVGGRFTLLERRGSTAAWVRFLAEDGESDALVTLRALHREAVADLDLFDAFDGPLRTIQRVVHPAVERVVEVGVSGSAPFLVAERVEGPSLERLLAPLLAERQPLAVPAALRIARGIAAALAAVHGAGAVHGALRPAAVALDPRGQARLTELGLALALPAPGVDPSVDRALGPPRYLAPERLAGGEPTAAADLYAAGALLAELVSGRALYGEEGADDGRDSLRERMAAGPPELPDATELPDALVPILARCLDADPAARYADGAELAEALEPVRAEILSR